MARDLDGMRVAILATDGVERAEAIMVGDHHMDIVAGRAAGIRSLAMVHGKLDHKAFADSPPDHFLRSFAELQALVPEL